MKEFIKGKSSWVKYARGLIIMAYEGHGGESIADKEVFISEEKTITKAEQLAEYLKEREQETMTKLQVFDAMNELRKVKT